jgi:hypothetical protein
MLMLVYLTETLFIIKHRPIFQLQQDVYVSIELLVTAEDLTPM